MQRGYKEMKIGWKIGLGWKMIGKRVEKAQKDETRVKKGI